MAEAPTTNWAKYALGLHTTSPELALGLNNFKGDSRYQTWSLGRDLSTHLHECLTQFMVPQTWSDLWFIAVAKGPGSFTGSRIGIVTARTLAQQLDIPLFAISTLAAIAWSEIAMEQDHTAMIAVEMPAQRNEVFAAIYRVTRLGLTPVLPDVKLSIHDWQQTLENWSFQGQLIQIDDGKVSVENACKALLDLAYQQWQQGVSKAPYANKAHPHWSEAIPFYGQPLQTP